MSILIRGMEMPIFEHQSWDICKGADGKWYMVDNNAETSDGAWHEIVPVPPHGKLADVDALIKKLTLDDEDGNSGATLLMAIFLEVLKAAPTIIEAEEGE